MSSTWQCVLALDSERSVKAGSPEALAAAIRRGADLRVGTDFRHNEHVDSTSGDTQVIREVSDFRTTYLLDDRWVAAVMSLRMPVAALDGWGPRASMSFFMYNQNGQQAIARPYLDGLAPPNDADASPGDDLDMPKMHVQDNCDVGTNAPAQNFIYDFDEYRYLVRDEWQELYAHDAGGSATAGSIDTLEEAFVDGGEIKVAIEGLCADLAGPSDPAVRHEVFVHCGPGYFETESRRFAAGAQPTVRIRPAIPLWYRSRAWDFGWLLPRTDGVVFRWLCDPFTLKFTKSEKRHAIRWFGR